MIYLLISDLDKGSFSGDCEQKYYWTLCTKKPGKNMRCKGVALLHRHAEKWDGKLSFKKMQLWPKWTQTVKNYWC